MTFGRTQLFAYQILYLQSKDTEILVSDDFWKD